MLSSSSSWMVIFLCGIWYSTSGSNNIAVQKLVENLKADAELELDAHAFASLLVMSTLTMLQLGSGAIVAGGLWKILTYWKCHNKQPLPTKPHTNSNRGVWIVSGLHGLGSYATNMGYCYGSATLVQQIKLLEPIETMLVSVLVARFLIRDERKFEEISCGMAASVVLVVGGALVTVYGKKYTSSNNQLPPNSKAIAYAILSGIFLSCRNVIKKHFSYQQSQMLTSVETTKSTLTVKKLRAQLSSFASLSVRASAIMAIFVAMLLLTERNSSAARACALLAARDPAVLLYHVLYNLASLSVLSLVAASTHALLNVGKRYSNIATSISVFHEDVSKEIFFGMLLSLIGSVWYWSEKTANTSASTSSVIKKLCISRSRITNYLVVTFLIMVSFFQLLWFQRSIAANDITTFSDKMSDENLIDTVVVSFLNLGDPGVPNLRDRNDTVVVGI